VIPVDRRKINKAATNNLNKLVLTFIGGAAPLQTSRQKQKQNFPNEGGVGLTVVANERKLW
jgi:hypothetical protein